MIRVCVIDAVRTPIGRIHGVLAAVHIEDLLAPLITALLVRNQLAGADIDEVIVGNAAGPGGNPARVALLSAGLPVAVPGLTVDRQCGSGLEAINLGARLIQSGAVEIVVAGGAESPSTAPLRARVTGTDKLPEFYQRARFAPDSVGDPDMGIAAENVAEQFAVTRQRQDNFAWQSHQKALTAIKNGRFSNEIVGVSTNGLIVTEDECPRPESTLDSLAALAPVFKRGGTVTAGNACPINDGAALVVMMAESRWRDHSADKQTPALRFVDSVVAGVDPNLLGTGPVPAVQRLLRRHGLTPDDIDQIEFNEAFAAQVLASMDLLNLCPSKLNPGGGALALGHPFGASGAILVTRLLHDLQENEKGLATFGIGGGMGLATLFECIPLQN